MLRKLITWGAIFVLSILISTQTAIEQGAAFFWGYIGLSAVIMLITTIVYKVIGELDDVPVVLAFLAALLLFAFSLGISAFIAWLVSVIFSTVDFYLVFQIVLLVFCFVPDKNKK